jgi:hypothetical protein
MMRPIATATDRPSSAEPAHPAFVPRVFISHSSADNGFGLELVARLQRDLGTAADIWYDGSGKP